MTALPINCYLSVELELPEFCGERGDGKHNGRSKLGISNLRVKRSGIAQGLNNSLAIKESISYCYKCLGVEP